MTATEMLMLGAISIYHNNIKDSKIVVLFGNESFDFFNSYGFLYSCK